MEDQDAAAAAFLNLKVKGQDGRVVFFKVGRDMKLQKLFTVYCKRREIEYKSVEFLLNGQRIFGKQTPDQLNLEDGDEIDAMMHQFGGGGCEGHWIAAEN